LYVDVFLILFVMLMYGMTYSDVDFRTLTAIENIDLISCLKRYYHSYRSRLIELISVFLSVFISFLLVFCKQRSY